VRELENVMLDRGDLSGAECDDLVQRFRDRFETIMGNNAGGILSHMGGMIREKMDAVVHPNMHPQGEAQGSGPGGPGAPQHQQRREHV
jgi:hypothetical protein